MRFTRGICLSGAALASLALTVPALAQEVEGESATVEQTDETVPGEIVVTAQFRSQRLQQTPIAITAMNAEGLESRNFKQLTDLTDSAPNVVLKPTNSAFGPGAAIFIRGVGQYDTNFAYEPGVGLYVDDVYHGAVFGSQLDLLDLDRVEILRGPQGTLAGKNSIGGAVKLYTKKPSGEGGFIEGTIGSRDRMDLTGSADFTVVPDRVFMRLSGVTRHQDGYLTRYDFGCANPGVDALPATGDGGSDCVIGHEGGRDYTVGRAALRVIASDDVEINLSASKMVDDSEPSANKLLAFTVSSANTPGLSDEERALLITGDKEYSSYASYFTPAFSDAGGDHPATQWEPNNKLRAWDVAGTIDWAISDALSLKSITAYQELRGAYSSDYDATPYGINTSRFTNSHKQFTQELRLNGTSFADTLDWTVGAYYYNATSYIEGGDIISPGLASSSVFYSDDRIPAESISGFAHGVVHLTDSFNLTGGIRYTHDTKDYYFRRLNPFDLSEVSYTAQYKIDGGEGHYKGDRWDYRLNADYQITPDLMVYAQFSTGYRGGGVNPRPFVVEQVVPFDPETLQAYEAGFKSDWFGRSLRLNVSAFINDYKDIIFSDRSATVVDGEVISAINSTPTNAGNARIFGIEGEFTLRPVTGLTIDGSASYMDFDFTSIGKDGVTISGVTLDTVAPYVTKWKASAGIQYEADLGDLGLLTPRFDLAYQSSFYGNINNDPATLVPAYTIMNARLAWTSPDEDWQLALSVTNLADKFYYRNISSLPIGIVTGQPGTPREWSLSLRRNF